MNKITNIRQNDFIQINDDSITIKDANGTIVSNNISDFTNVNIRGVEDSRASNVQDDIKKNKNFFKVICDSNNNTMTENDVIQCIKNGEASSLDVTIEITHSGIPINSAYYESESMCEDYLTLANPYLKPLIKNHDLSTEPVGRIKNAEFGQSTIIDGHDTIFATFTVSDTESMLKFADGRYNTVSIGAHSSNIKCDLCRKTILKDGVLDFCGHWRGNTYKGKKATWTMTKLDYSEVSVVNEPADKFAQVTKIKLNKGGSTSMGNNNNNSNSTQNILNTIDNALGNNADNQTTAVQNNQTNDNQNSKTNESNDNQTNQTQTSVNDSVVNSQEYKDLEEKYNKVLNDNKELQETINSLNIDVQNHMHSINTKDAKIDELITNLKSLAELNLSLLKDKLTLINPDIAMSALDNKTANELDSMINEAKENIVKLHNKSRVQVASPGLCIDNNNKNEETSEVKNNKNFNDVSRSILNIWR